ncbi:hypothetical protein PR202_ga17588 [Eleusine coracana subsp. coracana]|uniref:Uncharacterized protein n=1 Tax=Eleusine coracana subsp. coracana TaxID=191504 RepID=A0AAV5CPH2_ELECO|nr:hypothetical protein PR202_ga17341 [Eleusine coracana subsp. coracana]GJN00407.1 hypothetical protein PR202_ga17588 [Eleusine coracana subsp. coracana]
MRNYVGNVVRETVSRLPSDGGEHFQELVDWVEEHKRERFAEAAMVGLACPTLKVAAMTSFRLDTDFGFGRAALSMPVFTFDGEDVLRERADRGAVGGRQVVDRQRLRVAAACRGA